MTAVFPLPPHWQQAWARGWYPIIEQQLAPVSAALPIAALNLALVGGALLLAWMLVRLRQGPLLHATGVVLRVVAVTAAVVWLAFQGLWGWHYQTPSLERQLLGDRPQPEAPARATEVARHAVAQLNALYQPAHGQPWPDTAGVAAQTEDGLTDTLRQLGVTWRPRLPLPRRSWLDAYFRWSGIDGMTNPFGLEVLLNEGLLDVERPAVLAHEWAHLAGFADESDASFIAWMAGLRGGSQQAYAAWLGVLPHLVNALPVEQRRGALSMLEAGPASDLRAIAARAQERWPALQQVAWRTYDGFLKANRVPEGIARYDAVTRLILGAADERTGRLRPDVMAGRRLPEP